MTTFRRPLAAAVALTCACLLLALPAFAQTMRGSFTNENAAAFFDLVQRNGGKTRNMNISVTVDGTAGRFRVIRAGCIIRLFDTAASSRRVIEIVNVDGSSGTELRRTFSGAWAIAEVRDGKRGFACGSGAPLPPIRPGERVFTIDPVG
jgi:hypothetical protein